MSYRIFWIKKSGPMLAEAWLKAKDRNNLTLATKLIDDILERDPHGVGESRNDGERIWFITPLQVYYRIDDVNRHVFVTDIKLNEK